MQAEIQTLKDTRESEATHSGSNLQTGLQNSDLVPGSGPPPNKKQKTVSQRASEEDEEKECDPEEFVDLRCSKDLVLMSEVASSFIEASFNVKLKNSDRLSHVEKFGVPDSRWPKCPDLDPVVSSIIPAAAHLTDRAASWFQNL